MSPDKRKHRMAHPEDEFMFATKWIPMLRDAVTDLSWLLGRGYSDKASLKLVGDHFNLTDRQRLAISRCACAEEMAQDIKSREQPLEEACGKALMIDGFNLIITLEAAISGGILLLGRDGAMRDMSSVHGSYRTVEETDEAIDLATDILCRLKPADVLWLLDKPVSNSGKLAQRLRDAGIPFKGSWRVELVNNPDRDIAVSNSLVITSDMPILAKGPSWINAARRLVEANMPDAWIVDLSKEKKKITVQP